MRRRRLSYVCALVTLLTVSPAFAAAKPGTSWAQAELKTAVAAGLMAKEAAAQPNKPLTRGELETLVAGLTHAEPVPTASPTKTVTMASLDARLVGALGLTDQMPLVNVLLGGIALGLADGPTEAHKVNLARMLLKNVEAESGDWPSEMLDVRREAVRAKYGEPIAH